MDFEKKAKEWEAEFKTLGLTGDRRMWVMGILSDVQELMSRETAPMLKRDMANEWLNKAKYHLIQMGKGA